jgi:2-methylisocitrate lyase-like PEP mutase family enzyme
MAAAAGIVVAQDYAAPDSDNRTIKERLTVLQEVRDCTTLPNS